MDLNLKNFDEFVTNNKLVVIKFWLPNSKPCLNDDELDLPKVKIGKIEYDFNYELVNRFNIIINPSYLVYKNYELIDILHGLQSRDTLLKYF